MKKRRRPLVGLKTGSTPSQRLFYKILAPLALLAWGLIAQAQTFSPHLTGPYAAVGDRFFIRTYLVYCQTLSGTWVDDLGPDERRRRTARTFQVLNDAFQPHGIAFVPAAFGHGGCDTVFMQTNQSPWPEYSNGLTIHIHSDDNGGFSQPSGILYSTTLPATKFWIRGNEGGIPASNLPLVVSLAGHCLGLANTAAFTTPNGTYLGPPASCKPAGCAGSNNPNDCCGDLVHDTGWHGAQQVNWTSGCETILTPVGMGHEVSMNYMTNSFPSRCRNHFTVQQGNRMRQFLKQAPVLAPIRVASEMVPAGVPVVWNLPASKFSNIEVQAGATLVVDGVLEMAPGTHIVVRQGGTLIVNGRITAGCGGMWGGIVVEGDNAYAQTESNGQPLSTQGRFVLNASGVVEHAVHGVAVQGFEYPDQDYYGGGIVEVFGRLLNCTQGLAMTYYRHLGLPNAGRIRNAFFTLDDNYRGNASIQPVLINLRSINRLDISGTVLADNRTQNCTGRTTRARGIVADDAAFWAKALVFRHLDRAIWSKPMAQAGGKGFYQVENSNFFNCYTGIESSLPDRFRIADCRFLVGRPPACPPEDGAGSMAGIRLRVYQLPEGIELEGNLFQAGNSAAGDTLIGLDCNGTGSSRENTIRKNIFRNLTYGVRAAGNNGGAVGLRFECNLHDDNREADFYVLPGGSVRSVQGDSNVVTGVTTAAGNRFSRSGRSWLNKGAPIVYYHSAAPGQVSDHAMLVSEGILSRTAAAPNPACVASPTDCPPPCHVGAGGAWTTVPIDPGGVEMEQSDSAAGTFVRSVPEVRSGGTVRIYPNPTAGRFFVELPEGSSPVWVQVLAPDGRAVLEQTLVTSAELDGTGLHSGLYFCRVADASGLRLTVKLVVSR